MNNRYNYKFMIITFIEINIGYLFISLIPKTFQNTMSSSDLSYYKFEKSVLDFRKLKVKNIILIY